MNNTFPFLFTEKCSVSGIKCDNPECDFRDDTVKFEDYPQWLNRPCPMCGANLLTQADFDVVSWLMNEAEKHKMQSVPLSLRPFLQQKKYRVKLNGTGKIEYEEVDGSGGAL